MEGSFKSSSVEVSGIMLQKNVFKYVLRNKISNTSLTKLSIGDFMSYFRDLIMVGLVLLSAKSKCF